LTDGDGSFWVSIVPNIKLKIGYEIKPEYSIVASKNPANYKLMVLINSFFNGIGSIRVNKNTSMYEYKIQGRRTPQNCLFVMQHFLAYPLMTHRLVNFTLWCKVLKLIETKEHLTVVGFNKILSIKAAFPRSLNITLLPFGEG
jgi:hypothetical protein